MNTFKIRFIGLICHVGHEKTPRDKTHAVVIDARDHEHFPVLIIPDRPPISIDDFTDIRFDLPDGPATAQNDFMACVPGMKSLLVGGSITDEVRAAQHTEDDGVIAFVHFPQGKLTAPSKMPYPAEFQHGSIFIRKQCVAEFVEFSTTTDQETVNILVTVENDLHQYSVPSDSTIEIHNSTPGVHYELYLRLTDADAMATVVVDQLPTCRSMNGAAQSTRREPAAQQCESGHQGHGEHHEPSSPIEKYAFPDPECANSGWP